jgi:hypothetical protein
MYLWATFSLIKVNYERIRTDGSGFACRHSLTGTCDAAYSIKILEIKA